MRLIVPLLVSEKSTANEESQEGHEPVYRIHRMWGWGDEKERVGGKEMTRPLGFV